MLNLKRNIVPQALRKTLYQKTFRQLRNLKRQAPKEHFKNIASCSYRIYRNTRKIRTLNKPKRVVH